MKKLICLVLIGLLGYLCLEAKEFKGSYHKNVIETYGEPTSQGHNYMDYKGKDCNIRFHTNEDGYITGADVSIRPEFKSFFEYYE